MTDREKRIFDKLLDEKFRRLEEKIDSALLQHAEISQLKESVSNLKTEVAVRPTVFQLLSACFVTLSLAVAIAGYFF